MLEETVGAGGADEEAFRGLCWGVFVDLDSVDDALPEVRTDGVHGSGCIILNKKEIAVKPQYFVSGDDLDVRQALLIGADLILAFDDQHAARL